MERQVPGHRRNASSKSSRPRASTKGPLEIPDDLISSENPNSPKRSPAMSLAESSGPSHVSCGSSDQYDSIFQIDSILARRGLTPLEKNLSYLLRPDLYHPLTQLDIPLMFRSAFHVPPSNETLLSSLSTLNVLLAEGHFLIAAHLCGTLLTSAVVSPTDNNAIFTLLYTRLACLELTGNTALAAQESKALEDLSSTFYYNADAEPMGAEANQTQVHHIVPWPLRVLAIRLQSIGFGDVRRGIAGLYELGLEARREIIRPGIDKAEREIWKARLADLGIRGVNALVEMGDLDAARRSLRSLTGTSQASDIDKVRIVLLHLRIGDVGAAKELLSEFSILRRGILKPLLDMAEGRYDDAVASWRSLLEKDYSKENEAMISQNLAVCLLYTGQLNESRALLESLVSANYSFQSLTFNLSTIYELCSDKSKALKTRLAEEVSKQSHFGETNLDRPNADFKL
ncbi:hypothetical protein V8E54_002421 [Elaphomyces granulatus]